MESQCEALLGEAGGERWWPQQRPKWSTNLLTIMLCVCVKRRSTYVKAAVCSTFNILCRLMEREKKKGNMVKTIMFLTNVFSQIRSRIYLVRDGIVCSQPSQLFTVTQNNYSFMLKLYAVPLWVCLIQFVINTWKNERVKERRKEIFGVWVCERSRQIKPH